MMNQSEDIMNNNPSSNSNLYEDAVDREDLARSNVTSANIYRNLLLQERDEREQAALRIGLRKAIVKGRLKRRRKILRIMLVNIAKTQNM